MEILSNLLKSAAPAVATALLGPAGGIAVKFLGDALLGDPEAPLVSITEAVKQASPEQLADLNERYEAETARLIAEQGEITDTLVAKIDGPTANKVAFLRMTTRPWAVRKMVYAMLLPLYVFWIDVGLTLINSVMKFYDSKKAFDLLGTTFLDGESVYIVMYGDLVAPAATIVVSYMTLRQIEKSGNPLKGLGKGIAKIFGK